MKIPSCFYGTRLETRKECAKVARKVWKGVPLLEAVSEYELIDTREVPFDTKEGSEGCLVVGHPFCRAPQMRHFYMNWIIRIIEDKLDTDNYFVKSNCVFNQLIEYDWGILCLSEDPMWFSASSARRLDRRHRWQPYLRKLCEFWDVFCGEGKRYIRGVDCTTLWAANRPLRSILYKMGVPKEEADMYSSQYPAKLKELCDKYNLLTMDVLNDPGILARYPITMD